MNCDEMNPLLHAYSDHELDLEHSLAVERHLQTCPACAAEKRSIQSLRSALRRGDLAYRASPQLRDRIRSAIGGTGAKTQPRSAQPRFWQWLALGATAFAAITLILRPAGISSRDQLADEAIANHVRSLMASHLTDVASSDQHTVKPWFNGRIDFAPTVTDFAAQGFPLVGGRLDYLDGRNVAALVYQRDKHFINVFIWPAAHPVRDDVFARRGYSIVNRNFSGMHYCFVSDLNAPELARFAELLR